MTHPSDRQVSPGSLTPAQPIPAAYETFNGAQDRQRALSTKQVSQWLRLSEGEIDRLASSGALPAQHTAEGWRFGAVAINRWLEGPSHVVELDRLAETIQPVVLELADLRSELERLREKIIPPEPTGAVKADDEVVAFDLHQTPTLEAFEEAYIRYVLITKCDGNKSTAAAILGVDPSTLYRKLARYSWAK